MTTISGKCPICGKPSHPKYRPACSSQCSYVDLGRWLGEQYRIPGPPLEMDDDPPSSPDAA